MRVDAPHRPDPAIRGYRIERLIGTGGAAAVYEARRLGPRGPGERVACKVSHAERRDEPRHRDLVRQEAVLGLRVTGGHPSLVEILDFFDDAHEQHCIVMELVDGASVAELRGPDRRLPFPVVRRVAVEVLEALAYLHGRGVLHRDLSPRNILVTTGGAMKLADLGNARVMEQGLVHTETIRGTPMYVPREAIERLPLDARADLFSLGAILYELVTGAPPCGHQSLVAKMFARTAIGKFAPLPPDTPADLAELITGLIQPERDARRPQTAAEALALLRGHGLPVANAEELAGLVPPAQACRDQELRDVRPDNELPPGYVLVSRDAQEPADAPAAPALGVAGREVHLRTDRAGDEVPHHVSDPAPDGVAERVIDVPVERVADAAPERVADAPRRVTRSVPGRDGGSVGRRRPRTAARRALLVAALLACVLVPMLLRDHVLRDEQTAIERMPPREAPAPEVVPTPPPPIAPVVVTPMPVQESPRRAAEPADHRHSKRIEGQRRSLRVKPSAPRWRPVPHENELPPWGLR